jgi:hypothetical protein
MRRGNRHPSDQDLVLAFDGEATPRKLARMQRHIAQCDSCCKRVSVLQNSLSEVAWFYRAEFEAKISEPSGPTAMLRARLSEIAPPALRTGSSIDRLLLRHSRLALACSIVLTLLVGAWTMNRLGVDLRSPAPAAPVEPGAVPKPDLTPGAALPLLAGDVCDAMARQPIPRVPRGLRTQVFEAYGIKDPVPGAYEVDYLISPGLGGAAELKNLWPEPYFNIEWNARVKDALEERLQTMVCRGDLDIKTAQHEIASNWIAAYRKYFHSNRPLPNPTRVAGINTFPGFKVYPPVLTALLLRSRY